PAPAEQHVGEAQRAGLHLDHHLAGTGSRVGHLIQAQHVRRLTESVHLPGAHQEPTAPAVALSPAPFPARAASLDPDLAACRASTAATSSRCSLLMIERVSA